MNTSPVVILAPANYERLGQKQPAATTPAPSPSATAAQKAESDTDNASAQAKQKRLLENGSQYQELRGPQCLQNADFLRPLRDCHVHRERSHGRADHTATPTMTLMNGTLFTEVNDRQAAGS